MFRTVIKFNIMVPATFSHNELKKKIKIKQNFQGKKVNKTLNCLQNKVHFTLKYSTPVLLT